MVSKSSQKNSEPKPKRPIGRPRTSIDDLPEGWQQIIKDTGQEGGSEVEARCHLGITKDQWYTLLNDSVEFSETVKAAKALCEAWWETQGRKMVTGSIDGNATVWIFNMKNRFGWRDKQDVELTGKDGGPVQTLTTQFTDPQDAARFYADLMTKK